MSPVARREAFEPDGSLRDICVLGTTLSDWVTRVAPSACS
jgi:hypothetical protein